MTQYDSVAQSTARMLTLHYSTSFGAATRLLGAELRSDIYNIYGMVRVADEIVDTYPGTNKAVLLHAYEHQVYAAIELGYSTDLVLHAFQLTANKCGITKQLIVPFFNSMRFDLEPFTSLTTQQYETYIYGSAEVVGLMCLKVFCQGDTAQYEKLKSGAQALGAAFQKVNFLRDRAADMQMLGRNYFPGTSALLDEDDKLQLTADIRRDFVAAHAAIKQLPKSGRPAVMLAYQYYIKLLQKLERTPVDVINTTRIRIPNAQKTGMLGRVYIAERLKK